jgi:3-dehydroquinate dehydratase/shikimate dehydrogenase
MIVSPSIAPRSMADAIKRLRRLSTTHELVEIRIDAISDLNLEKLLSSKRPQLIVTNRHSSEGGFFKGTMHKQAAILSEAQSRGAEYVDVEYRMGKKVITTLLKKNKRVILSYHNIEKTPSQLPSIYRQMRQLKPDIIKISVTARDVSDNQKIFEILRRAKHDREKMVAHCMGERGEISRILTGKFGGYLSFAAETAIRATGPGQLSVKMMTDIYHADKIDAHTKIFGLIGNPVRQSRGIYYHNAIFQKKRKNAVYLNFLVDDINSFFKSFRSLMTGGSLTMPFKESIIPLLDRVDETAGIISSVNTILSHRGRWHGCNTDLPALVKVLKTRASLKGKRILIIGTGALARTMIFAMLREGAIPIITGRSASKVKQVSEQFNCRRVTSSEYSEAGADIIMNATSIGMIGDVQSPIVPRSFYRQKMIFLDGVYRPTLTPFLSYAKKAGCEIISGNELFSEQAKLQSQLFLNVLP